MQVNSFLFDDGTRFAMNADKAAARRRAEDAVANADNAVVEAQAALDKASVDRRAGRGSDVDREAARTALSQAQERSPVSAACGNPAMNRAPRDHL
jgi:hypothetical protein